MPSRPRTPPSSGQRAEWRRELIGLAAFVAACLAVAAIGGMVTARSVGDWYQALVKPSFTPPDWVFGPVWTGLYIVMAVAAWRVWRRPPGRGRTIALGAFALQLALNLTWSCLFFGLRAIGTALVEIVVLLAAIAATAAACGRTDRWAGWLLVPYLVWVAFATALNAAIWHLNPD